MNPALALPRLGVPPSDPRVRAWLRSLGRIEGPMADTRVAYLAELDRIVTRDLAFVSPAHALPCPGDWRTHARRAIECHRAWRGDEGARALSQHAADAAWRLDVVRRAIEDDRAGGGR